jgi:DNA mismatch repair protein MutS2
VARSLLPIPDLLCAQPSERVDSGSLRQALVFAFAAGGSPEAFDEAIANAVLPASSWDRADFARDVYLEDLVVRCLPVTLAGKPHRPAVRYLVRAVGEPPRSIEDIETRRAVLSELVSTPSAREALERVVAGIVRVRNVLCAARQPAPRVRRMEILRALREVFELLATSFEGTTSALARMREFGRAVVDGEEHRRLVALLDHDEHMGSLDVQVRVGADGEVRAMQIVGVREDRGNPFYVPALRRFLARLVLFFRGYRTTSGEVAERLLSEAFAGVEYATALLFQLLGDAEVLLASLGLRDRAIAAGLEACLPSLGEPASELRMEGLYNPLLLAAGVDPVPCDVSAAPAAVVVVTGPNSGGKTRMLQAVAIGQLLAQGGFFAPMRRGQLPRATGLFASLFEEARADQPEGHLGMELLRIRRLFDRLDPGGLVVLDELCSGTNPSEGEEIARLVLSLLPGLGAHAFVTTHLLKFASSLHGERSTAKDASVPQFLQVELDARERPTYRFVPGVAKTSLALATAARLGVTREELEELIAKKRGKRDTKSTREKKSASRG